ncbi:MAG: hypothetical protein KGL53_03865 [Elusimicrobia bacterium]|nr:hypothetical protein [Elusimicrobiota bacterium]
MSLSLIALARRFRALLLRGRRRLPLRVEERRGVTRALLPYAPAPGRAVVCGLLIPAFLYGGSVEVRTLSWRLMSRGLVLLSVAVLLLGLRYSLAAQAEVIELQPEGPLLRERPHPWKTKRRLKREELSSVEVCAEPAGRDDGTRPVKGVTLRTSRGEAVLVAERAAESDARRLAELLRDAYGLE